MRFYVFQLLMLLLSITIGIGANLKNEYEGVVFIFVHGIFDTSCQSEQYSKILPGAVMISFDFDDAMRIPFIYRPFYSSLGQEDEIEKLSCVYESIVTLFENRSSPVPPIVLIGISRGASTILNFLAAKQPKYVVAAICESPFDSIQYIAQNTAHHYLPKSMQHAGESLFFSCFPNHNPDGINPSNCVKDIDPKIPILFVASKGDVRVPYESTERLFTAMKVEGKNVSFMLFELGKHAKILKKNRDEYKEVIDCFLQDCLS